MSPEVKIELGQIKEVLATEVLKREVMEGDKAEDAAKKIAKAAKNALRATQAKTAIAGTLAPEVASPDNEAGLIDAGRFGRARIARMR